jgi:rubrerythrin
MWRVDIPLKILDVLSPYMSQQDEKPRITTGAEIYTEDGRKLGTVRGFDEHGFNVTAEGGIEGLSIEHHRAGHEFGEGELMWRCWKCGEMGKLDGDIPDECPSCGTEKEDIYYWTED